MRKILASFSLVTICLFVASLSFALDPAAVVDGHVYLLESINGIDVPDSSPAGLTGILIGDPQIVGGAPRGMAMKFDGVDDGVHIPDGDFINITNGPWPNRTVIAVFNCADVNKTDDTGVSVKQMVFEEGGATRGINIYVFEGNVHVGLWNLAEYNADLAWEGSWPSAPIGSNEWHAVALVLRDAPDEVADGKFEMWMDGKFVTAEPSGQIYNHSADNAIGYTKGDTYYPGGSFSGDGNFFEGMVDELWILNEALSDNDLREGTVSVEPAHKLTGTWGSIKAQ